MATKRHQESKKGSLKPQTQKWVESLSLFPYQRLRPFQTQFLKAIAKNRRIIVQAPTGAGKTIVALSALLPSVDIERGISLIIFTRTKSQVFDAHLREIANLSKSRESRGGRMIQAIPLISKGDLCISPERKKLGRRFICSSKTCNAFKQTKLFFFEKSQSSELYRLFIHRAKEMSPELMVELLQPYGCPYQLVRGLCQHADVVITTHTYLTSEGLRGQLKNVLQRQTFISKFALVDEVHNLSHRITTILSRATLEKAHQIKPEFRVFGQLMNLIDRSQGIVSQPLDLDIAPLYVFCDQNIAVSHTKALAPLFDICDFLETEGDIWISDGSRKLLKLDPFPAKAFTALEDFAKVVAQSGTLYPLGSYCKYFEIDAKSRGPHQQYIPFSMPSPKPNEFNAILDNNRFTSSFKRRTAQTPLLMAETISKLHGINPGHTLVFTPSHDLKTAIANRLTTKYVEKKGPGEYPKWLDELRYRDHEIILGVMSGRLSEGVQILDAKSGRSRIKMVIIVGLPYMRPDLIGSVLEKLYIKRYGRNLAREFLLEMPMRRQVLQAIGRGIRSERDFCTGIILDYRARFGSWVPQAHIYRYPDALVKGIKAFYKKFEWENRNGHNTVK